MSTQSAFKKCSKCQIIPESIYHLSCAHNLCLYCLSKKIKQTPQNISDLTNQSQIYCPTCQTPSFATEGLKEIFTNAINFKFPTCMEEHDLFISQLPLINYYYIVEGNRSIPKKGDLITREIYTTTQQALKRLKSDINFANLADKMEKGIIMIRNLDGCFERGMSECVQDRKSRLDCDYRDKNVEDHGLVL